MYEWVVADWQMLLRGVQLKFNTKGAVTQLLSESEVYSSMDSGTCFLIEENKMGET